MSITIVEQRLAKYQPKTVLEEENALKEIAQEIALLALSRAGFFKVAAFQGGTCLRILYGLERFSEDLDFILQQPTPAEGKFLSKHFMWKDFLNDLKEEFKLYGYDAEVHNRSKVDNAVKKTFIKTNSIGELLILNPERALKPFRKLQIKLEIDTNPPGGSAYEMKYIDFPIPFGIYAQDLPSLFAGKCHALLCRKYVKGRDWYDFVWYIAREVVVNFIFLENALNQMGPWQNQKLKINKAWFLKELKKKIESMDWQKAKQDVQRFLKPSDLLTLELWSKDFFIDRLQKLASYL